MSDDEETHLVCVPVKAMANPREGSVMSVCQKCETPIWMSPEGIKFIKRNPQARVTCTNCTIDLVGPEEFNASGQMVPGSPEWMNERLEVLKQELDLSKVLRTSDDE